MLGGRLPSMAHPPPTRRSLTNPSVDRKLRLTRDRTRLILKCLSFRARHLAGVDKRVAPTATPRGSWGGIPERFIRAERTPFCCNNRADSASGRRLRNSLAQPEAVDSSKTLVTWSKRNSAATLFMASLSKMLAKPAVHKKKVKGTHLMVNQAESTVF